MNTSWFKDLNLKPRSNSVKTFKSYIDLDNDNQKASSEIASHGDHQIEEQYEPYPKEMCTPEQSLLPGELAVCEAENVLKFNTLSDMNKGISGVLHCSNFKLSFLTAETFASNLHQKNPVLAENDVCLINISGVYHVTGGKRKKLSVTSPVTNIEVIEIHCKDFRIFTFSFKFSPVSQRSVISAIIHHAFVPKINLLFTFDYKDKALCSSLDSTEAENHSLLFTRICDWETELQRCGCPGWRVTLANEKFLLCESLPECFVVPSILLDMNLNKSAPHFRDHRIATWSWGMPSGASIVRMAALDPSISDSRQKDILIDAISRAGPRKISVKMFNLDECCPSYKEVQSSFLKLKELCMPTSANEFWETDGNYYSNLESSKWLHHVSSCLSKTVEAAMFLLENKTVVLSEHEGRDISTVISCLIQMMLDPFYRTTAGFEILIQKEWVALGHPFTDRHHLVSGCESEESPIFLLFLDCVYQLSEQCPTVFEFSETYLTTLWDSCQNSLFDTLLFNSQKSRREAMLTQNGRFALRSVWKWFRRFPKNDQRLFCNPLHLLNNYSVTVPSNPKRNERPKTIACTAEHSQCRPLLFKQNEIAPIVWNDDEENLLRIDPHVKSLKLWHQCYLRWLPLAHIPGGGPPVLFLSNLKINAEVQALESRIKSQSSARQQPRQHRRVASDDYTISADVLDMAQLQGGSSIITSVFPFAPVAPCDWSSCSVPSTSCLQISYTETGDDLDE